MNDETTFDLSLEQKMAWFPWLYKETESHEKFETSELRNPVFEACSMRDKNTIKEKNMPCMCWFEPPEKSKYLIKTLCKAIVDEVKSLEKIGDPMGCEIKDVQELLGHMYSGKCNENPKPKE